MKDFSDFEKKIIDKLFKLDDRLSLNVLNNILSGTFARYGEYYIEIESVIKCFIKIETNYFKSIGQSGKAISQIKEILEGTSRDIYIVVKLIEYLEKYDLIFSSGDDPVTQIGPKVNDAQYIDSSSFDTEICELLFKYSRKNFIPTEALRRLVKNNYLDDEEVRHRELVAQYETTIKQNRTTIKYSAIAICISLAAVFVAAFVPVSTRTTIQNPPTPVVIKVDETLLSNIDKSLIELNKNIIQNRNQSIGFDSNQIKILGTYISEFIDETKRIRSNIDDIKSTQQKNAGDAETPRP